MTDARSLFYEKKGKILVDNLRKRHFDAYYCADKEEALSLALKLIPEGSSVGWGGATSAVEIGLLDAIRQGNYVAFDRESVRTPEEREEIVRKCFGADYFLTGANALSLDGQMVNIDGGGNRVAAIVYGPRNVLVIAGMNKVCDTLEAAVQRARTIAAPINQQRFLHQTPCSQTGVCADCKSLSCICNQILITRHCRPQGRIQFIIVGEELGF